MFPTASAGPLSALCFTPNKKGFFRLINCPLISLHTPPEIIPEQVILEHRGTIKDAFLQAGLDAIDVKIQPCLM